MRCWRDEADTPACAPSEGPVTGISCLSGGAVEPATVLDELVRLGFELGPSEPYQVMVLDTPDARLVRAGARLDARPVYQPNSADAVELRVRGDAVPDRPVVVSRLPRTTRDLPAGRFRTVVGDLLRERALGVRMSFASSCAHALLRAADGAPQARIELHTEVVVHDERGRRREVAPDWCIELHLVGDRIKPVRRVQRRLRDLGLAVLAGDVLVWASDRGDVDLTGRQRHRRPTMRRREPAADVFRRVLHAYGDTIGDSWQGTVDDLDPEYLHELRVALRSGRSVWRAARDVLPAEACDDALDLAGALADRTGPARDLDVLVARWDDHVAVLTPERRVTLEPARDLLVRRRADAHAVLSAQLVDLDRDQWLASWRRLVDLDRSAGLDAASAPRDAGRRAGRVVADRVRREHRGLVRAARTIGDDTPVPALHELRKDGKRLRYLVEAFAPLTDGRRAREHRRRYLRRLKRLLGHLGELQDVDVHRQLFDRLREDLEHQPGGMHPATAAALDELRVVFDDQLVERRRAAVEAIAAFDRGSTRRARRALVDELRR